MLNYLIVRDAPRTFHHVGVHRKYRPPFSCLVLIFGHTVVGRKTIVNLELAWFNKHRLCCGQIWLVVSLGHLILKM